MQANTYKVAYEELQKKLGYTFKKTQLLEMALTHSSFPQVLKKGVSSYERLEFLGDAILQFVISGILYVEFSRFSEGKLTRARALVVREAALVQCAEALDLWQFIRMGKSESTRSMVPSVMADVFEALLAAVYLDNQQNIAPVVDIVNRMLRPILEQAVQDTLAGDFKTRLQEFVQKQKWGDIIYRTRKSWGPDHMKKFEMEVVINGEVMGTGIGKSKKDAEQEAAEKALENLTK